MIWLVILISIYLLIGSILVLTQVDDEIIEAIYILLHCENEDNEELLKDSNMRLGVRLVILILILTWPAIISYILKEHEDE